MPLPPGSVGFTAGESSRAPKPAFLIRFPEDAWDGIQTAAQDGGQVSISLDGFMTLHIPNHHPLPLESLPSGSTSEIHFLSPSPDPTLSLTALAVTKLSVPISSASSVRAANKLRAQTNAIDQERKERADRVNGVGKSKLLQDVATPMGRTQSIPVASGEAGPTIPLKTRVVQLLALGPTSVSDIVQRVGGAEQDVMRVVTVVGRQQTGGWTLQPPQYSKVKIGTWKYTFAEKVRVIRLAREAFDSLGLPSDADERVELEKKEAEVISGASSSSIEEKASKSIPEPLPTPLKATPTSAAVSKKKTPQTLIAKQMAKFAREKRASSMPNVKEKNLGPPSHAKHKSVSPVNEVSEKGDPVGVIQAKTRAEGKKQNASLKKEKAEVRNGKRKRDDPRRGPPAYTMSESGSVSGLKRTRTPDNPSSSEDEPPRGRSTLPTKPMRKDPPPELKLNGHSHLPSTDNTHPPDRDPETMRDRYDELFPAYDQLTRKLSRIHRAAEVGDEVEVGKDEVEKMVAKWERWHRELKGIRMWFGDGEP